MSNHSIDGRLRDLEVRLENERRRVNDRTEMPPTSLGIPSRPGSGRRPRPLFTDNELSSLPPAAPHATDTDVRMREVYKVSGKLNVNGVEYRSQVNDLQQLGELGSGSCGHVVEMLHKPSGSIIAVKQMRRSGNIEETKRILMDLDVVVRSHDCPYIVRCLGCFVTEADVWICMELMASCFDKLLKRLGAPIPEDILGKVTVATVNALSYLKETHGVIHRDVKPSNILLDVRGNVKLCDFGISGRLVDSKAKTRSAGCAAYMAPERIDPPDPTRPAYDIRADVWSLGISLVELATGVFPYRDCQNDFEVLTRVIEEDPPKLPEDGHFSTEFKQFVQQCLTKDYRDRPKYAKLLKHSFVVQSSKSDVSVAKWYASLPASAASSPQVTHAPIESSSIGLSSCQSRESLQRPAFPPPQIPYQPPEPTTSRAGYLPLQPAATQVSYQPPKTIQAAPEPKTSNGTYQALQSSNAHTLYQQPTSSHVGYQPHSAVTGSSYQPHSTVTHVSPPRSHAFTNGSASTSRVSGSVLSPPGSVSGSPRPFDRLAAHSSALPASAAQGGSPRAFDRLVASPAWMHEQSTPTPQRPWWATSSYAPSGSSSQPASLDAELGSYSPYTRRRTLECTSPPPPPARRVSVDNRWKVSPAGSGNTSPIVLQRFHHQSQQRRSRADLHAAPRHRSLSREHSTGRSPEPPPRSSRQMLGHDANGSADPERDAVALHERLQLHERLNNVRSQSLTRAELRNGWRAEHPPPPPAAAPPPPPASPPPHSTSNKLHHEDQGWLHSLAGLVKRRLSNYVKWHHGVGPPLQSRHPSRSHRWGNSESWSVPASPLPPRAPPPRPAD